VGAVSSTGLSSHQRGDLSTAEHPGSYKHHEILEQFRARPFQVSDVPN
jgi:hypothetical protein